MSKSGAPTLPWALPCYHQMQCFLCANVENDKLPLNLHGAATAGLARLNYYYAMARANCWKTDGAAQNQPNKCIKGVSKERNETKLNYIPVGRLCNLESP